MNIKEAKYYNFSGATAGIKLTLSRQSPLRSHT